MQSASISTLMTMRRASVARMERTAPTCVMKRGDDSSPHERPKRILGAIAFFLRTGDETDTVDRLFVSRHVNDLRLIAAFAFALLILVFALAAFAGICA